MSPKASENAGPKSWSQVTPVVFVVDDDVSVRESLELLILSAGWEPQTFESAERFLARPHVPKPSCLILDIAMPGLDGLELQKRVSAARADLPIIFVTGRGDVPMTVQAMKCGAAEFLTKPFNAEVLLNALSKAIERSGAVLEHQARMNALRDRYGSLSKREREVMGLVVAGLLNKQVGGELGISEITVKAHRGSVMRKMQATSLPDLVNMSAQLGIANALGAETAAEKSLPSPGRER